jgi:hypothetical protein
VVRGLRDEGQLYDDNQSDGPGARSPRLFKLGGAMATCGAIVAFVGNALPPRSATYYGDPVAWLNHQTHAPIWFLVVGVQLWRRGAESPSTA